MNDKQVKKIRRYVEGITDRDFRDTVYLQNKRTGAIINDPGTPKGIYRDIKKKARQNVPNPARIKAAAGTTRTRWAV